MVLDLASLLILVKYIYYGQPYFYTVNLDKKERYYCKHYL